MREIKFRAWKKNEGRPCGEWVSFNHKMLNNEAYEVMQYTGLKDRNGTEIYEGDIIKGIRHNRRWRDRPESNVEMIFKVFWDEAWLGWKIYYPIMKWSTALSGNLDGPYEVIGNIYENPELLPDNSANE